MDKCLIGSMQTQPVKKRPVIIVVFNNILFKPFQRNIICNVVLSEQV